MKELAYLDVFFNLQKQRMWDVLQPSFVCYEYVLKKVMF